MFQAAADERDVRAGFRKGARNPTSDTGAAASDDGDATFQDSVDKDFAHVREQLSELPKKAQVTNLRFFLTTGDVWPRLHDVDLALHVGPFDVLIFAVKDFLD